ncbi:MAG: aminotransferase class III-fold pyridoxal phosphate-dependent enzyme [Bacteroidota bacterium]
MKESDKFEYSRSSSNILQLYKPTSKRILSSKDSYVYDQEGKKYTDFESGVWCTNLGHSHDNIISLIDHQSRYVFIMDAMSHFSNSTERLSCIFVLHNF